MEENCKSQLLNMQHIKILKTDDRQAMVGMDISNSLDNGRYQIIACHKG